MTEGFFRLQCTHCGAWLKGQVGHTRFTCPKCDQTVKVTATPSSSTGQTPVYLTTPFSPPAVSGITSSPLIVQTPAPLPVMNPATVLGTAPMGKWNRKHLLIIAAGVGGVLVVGVLVWIMLPSRPKSVGALIAELNDKNTTVRREAAKALLEMEEKPKAATPALIAALNDGDSKVQFLAVKALAKIGPDHAEGQAAVPALTRLLKDQDKHVRYYAVKTLYKIGPEGPEAKAAVPALASLLSDADARVRPYAAKALRKIGPDASAAIPALKKAANDPDPEVRQKVAQALREIQKK